MSSQQESPLHSSFAQHLYAFREYAYTDILGPKIMPMRYVINVFKGLTFLWVLFLMAYFNNYSTASHATVLISTRNLWDLLAVQGFVLPGCFL